MNQFADDVAALQPYDDVERFLVFVEQLEVATDLLARGTLATSPAALVAVDNLADLLLHAHAEHVFSSSEGSRWFRRKRAERGQRTDERPLGVAVDVEVALLVLATASRSGRGRCASVSPGKCERQFGRIRVPRELHKSGGWT